MPHLLGLCDATFKPWVDKNVARDGVDVVLSVTEESLVVLHHEAGEFRVQRHRRDNGQEGVAEVIEFRGTRYGREAEVVARYGGDMTPDVLDGHYLTDSPYITNSC